MTKVQLKNLNKKFGNVTACDNVNLEVESKEILTLLGPSGCGKTTTLNCIAGFIQPDSGEVYVDKTPMSGVPPNKRNIAMVFQTWALWPHMSVYHNVAFGLKLKKVNEGDIRKRVREALELVSLSGFEERYPRQLSGGQQQRVALARALIINPRVILLDEPLSNLDAKLRQETRVELKKLLKEQDITAIYVTHDQWEALEISDRVAIMNAGKILQVGNPMKIYNKPENKFVADFIGETNLFSGSVTRISDDSITIETEEPLRIEALREANQKVGDKVFISIRPEDISIEPRGLAGRVHKGSRDIVTWDGEINTVIYRGLFYQYFVFLKQGTMLKLNSPQIFGVHDKVTVSVRKDKCVVIKA